MIAHWNEKVTSKDEVYILGDFSITKGCATEEIISRLNGKLYLISRKSGKVGFCFVKSASYLLQCAEFRFILTREKNLPKGAVHMKKYGFDGRVGQGKRQEDIHTGTIRLKK